MVVPGRDPALHAVFINLDRAGERRRMMEGQGERWGLQLERYAAVDAKTIPQGVSTSRGERWERPLTLAELGCFLSHEALWKRVIDSGKPLLILEDDVVLSPRINQLVSNVALLNGVEFLNLESCDRRRFVARTSRVIPGGLTIRRVFRDKSGSGAYVLWPGGAEKLLRRAKLGAAPVDAFLHGLRELQSFQVEPALAMQLHLLEARGLVVPISSATFIQAPREKLPFTRANSRYTARRVTAQLRLGVDHALRVLGRSYRPTEVSEADFSSALAGLTRPEAAGPSSPDQMPS